MQHGLDQCAPVLRRFAAAVPGTPMPSDWGTFAAKNQTLAMEVGAKDPELVSLLSGNASAGLKADALSGAFSPVPPDQKKEASKLLQSQVSDLLQKLDRDPDQMTYSLQLASLSPTAHANWKKQQQAKTPDDDQLRHQQLQDEAEDRRLRRESNMKGQAMAAASSRRFR